MIFGSKPVYKFATYNKKKMHTMEKAYPFDEAPVQISECPIKIANGKAEIFFDGPIFNTYVLSTEENVCILKASDDKLTFIKEILKDNLLYTVKIISEDDKTREVELFKFDEFFPGYKTVGKLTLLNNKVIFNSKFGTGPIVLQTNEPSNEVEAMLAHLDENGPIFVEINNPVERTTVKVVKDLKNMKIVENENIKGILLTSNKKVHEEVNVFVKNVYPGSYCFVEDISPGYAEVQLVDKQRDFYRVKYRDFFGECRDKRVSKTMKGMISNIKGNTFKFKQSLPENETRTKEFENLPVTKKIKVSTEEEIAGDQLKAISFIQKEISSKSSASNVIALFRKYIGILKEHDNLSIFFIKFLADHNELTQNLVSKIVKENSKNFTALASKSLDDKKALKMLFTCGKNLVGFQKLLESEDDKVKFIKENMEFFSYSIDFIYDHMTSPRVVTESVIEGNHKNWLLYLNKESGNYKRNLFRRLVKMSFKAHAMKEVFKKWIEFEESVGGNVEEARVAEQSYSNHKL